MMRMLDFWDLLVYGRRGCCIDLTDFEAKTNPYRQYEKDGVVGNGIEREREREGAVYV